MLSKVGQVVLIRELKIVFFVNRITAFIQIPGGSLGYLGGCIRSLSKLKNTPKALISGQKSTLILIKR